MPGDPKECREHAKCCLRLAAEAPSSLAKARFQELAETWMRLATDLELSLSLLEQWGDPRLKTGSDKYRREGTRVGPSAYQPNVQDPRLPRSGEAMPEICQGKHLRNGA